MDKPETITPARLRILLVINLPWDARLGAIRVYMQLMECWRAAGHEVEKFSFAEAFPSARISGTRFALRQIQFAFKAAAFVRQNAHRFDLIDALIGSLQGSKEKLGFGGLLVARSVGLLRLYQRLEPRRDDRQPRGRLAGRILHAVIQRWWKHAADAAVQRADLVNLPNEEEAACLRAELNPNLAVVVEPYGLTTAQREGLAVAAETASHRLAAKRISFIGMWSPRKGAFDWLEIMSRIWQETPEARFRFLGTMVEKQKIFSDLGLQPSERIELVPEYSSEELPALLADCSVGIFPSYVEGFGLAVLEQLAAGIPTVAFDAPGPRQILRDNGGELLTSPGCADAIADRATEILRMSESEYDALSARCRSIANQFQWEKIADDTIRHYRKALAHRRGIVFTQPFSVTSTTGSGGGRILRSLLRNAPMPALCICTSPEIPKPKSPDEIYLPIRPFFGRIEHTRFFPLPNLITPLFRRRFVKRLERICRSNNAAALHAVAHGGLDFHHAWRLAGKMGVPFFLQVHDDAVYTSDGRVPRKVMARCLRDAWLGAETRFVISNELGEEYNHRYGAREFIVVTDGIDQVAPAARPAPRQLRIYFMGMFHLGYEQNLQALSRALDLVAAELGPSVACTITLRCGGIRARVQHPRISILPFGSEADVQADFAEADWLYLPLHFAAADHSFVAYSLSTKMVTYLGSGIPILYHGPAGTGAHNLLAKHCAAAFMSTLDPNKIAHALRRLLGSEESSGFAANALALARKRFLRAEQHQKFWQPVTTSLRRERRNAS